MFGYEAGCFTGPNKKGKAGMIELAHKGTFFLDEVAELPLDI
ncbi:sigma 54-interacting transcriptional regulator [Alteribacillus bidgolensis]|nr:sigma 54-interacting transcriptional regulator [Alteribacillus bidgolensis]